VGGVELAFREWPGAGEPIVILHGMLGSSRNWMTAAKDLADAGHRVLAPDARNHGASPHADEMDYPTLASDLVAFLDRRELSRVILLGHSMGGKTAMLAACRHPDRVSRLIVVDIAPKAYRWVGHRMEFAAMAELDLASLHSRTEAEMRMEGRVPDWAMRKFLTTNLERSEAGWRWSINLPAITAALPLLEKDPLRPEDRYAGPAQFIVGGKSRYVQPDADLPAIRAHFPAARLSVLPSSGHNPHFDARAEFIRAVLP
jgi:pimeloyl-ACP methyl ester carboxylesterase